MSDLVKNRRAYRDFEILDTLEVGIQLKGTEIKSLRDNGGSLQEAYVRIIEHELWLIGAHIAAYKLGNIHNHAETRDRKLLLHKRELAKLKAKVQQKGLTIVPLSMYFKRNWLKLKIALARGKKTVDKRASIKQREDTRHLQRVMKHGSG